MRVGEGADLGGLKAAMIDHMRQLEQFTSSKKPSCRPQKSLLATLLKLYIRPVASAFHQHRSINRCY